ncbi:MULTISPECIES: acetyl-CoA hydrolase/transferase C-terminal domain-containing protein [unclassified Bradyrhizobium]|uniref:acetyl-CoA hydrolase/transferase family protein n=1 Tax=unclassified Bradyrhizobium TaxID=2631580 RepID=UPI00247B0288|nr:MULTISPECIES: acetyl-CoA hydrolase/transferase C-terminal domain-containing protein [unclassified Bradyrhizobium]WGR70019.1 4-hydroxybutyrate CoA-transferase [Bradyrhizobium sp. ISRA426]WGR82076.1 4-hydroxybutyrate CoA-transferase [Bradyrhizobium sp. ISRA430]WGR85262.1 4-hydroxybutyrate CoA-transferase [Bradyrhizobium sp. ISRA432]
MPAEPAPIDFTGLIQDGDLVVCGQATAEPVTLTEAFVAQAAQLPAFRMMVGPLFSETFSACTPNVSFLSYGVIGNARRLARAGRLDVIPGNYSAFCADFAARRHRADVVLVQLAEAADGGLSASLSNDYVIDAARGARLVIAEINPDAPFTLGADWPANVPIHVRVAARRPPVELPSTPLDDVSRRIAAHAASLISDRSTLQFGVGRIPDAILSSLSHARNLGIHSGLINDAVVDLIERGAVTNAEKGIDDGITVTNQVIGTARLYRFVHQNREVAVRPTSYTHGQSVLGRINRLVAINSALQVGLDGAVNSETLNGVAIGAIGGQLDFVRGANASLGGRAIIALPATASDGTSRIVANVETVTTPRADVDAIVTEWGIAELRGCGLAERARRMIAIAAPEHRDALAASVHHRE